VAKSKYIDFEEYAEKDQRYLIKILAGKLNEYQPKIIFLDGSSYNVTKTGNRYWWYVDFEGNYVGFKGEHKGGHQYWFSYLTNKHFETEHEFWQEIHFALGF
jgi:hypothetical protein